MFVKSMYLSMFYCLCYKMDISTDISKEQVLQGMYLDLNEEEDTRIDDSREEHWRDISKEGDYKKTINTLR